MSRVRRLKQKGVGWGACQWISLRGCGDQSLGGQGLRLLDKERWSRVRTWSSASIMHMFVFAYKEEPEGEHGGSVSIMHMVSRCLYGLVWWFSKFLVDFCWFLLMFNDFWFIFVGCCWFLVILNDFWLMFIGFWCFLVILADFWLIFVGFWSFWMILSCLKATPKSGGCLGERKIKEANRKCQ